MARTVAELEPVEVHPARLTREQWAAYHAFRRTRHQEDHPDEPVLPDEVEEMQLLRDDPFRVRRLFWVWDGQEVVAEVGCGRVKEGAPGYESGKHLLWAGGGVVRDHRRQGIGRRLLRTVLPLLHEYGATKLGIDAEQPDGRAFLEAMGFESRFTGRQSRLDFQKVDWGLVRRWVEEGERRSPDTRLELYDPRIPEELLDDFCPVLTRMLNTMPLQDLDHGEIVVTPAMARERYARFAEQGRAEYTALTREPDGSVSGVTDVSWAPYDAGFIYQGFTGVWPEARGRGLGKWLKAAMLEHLRRKHPETLWVVTDNATTNEPMLAINIALGFREHRRGSSYQITVEELERTLATPGGA